MRASLSVIVVSVALSLISLCAVAQDTNEQAGAVILRPGAATRIVDFFDFEEAAATTQPVPPHWLRVLHNPPARELPHFPAWNASRYDDTFATSGRFSIMLPVAGGSTRLRLSGGVLPALPDADYAINASIRTQGLIHARARVIVRFLDESLSPIPDAFVATELLRAERAWEHIELELPGRARHAAWIQIDLEVLQPNELPTNIPDDTRIEMEDFHGAAWFDDIEIRQLPRVQLRTNALSNVIVAPEVPLLVATVRDLTGEALSAKITIFDIDNSIVDSYSFQGVSRGQGVDWKPSLPRFGWYRAELSILSNKRDIATTILPFVWAPSQGRDPLASPSRFGITVEDIKAEQFSIIPALVDSLGVGSIHLPVWDVEAPLIDYDEHINTLDVAVHSLLNASKSITLTMPGIPTELAAITHIDPQLPLLLTDAPAARWTGYLDPILTRFGQRITKWQPGRTGLDRYRQIQPLAPYIDSFYEILARLSPEPVIVLPWQAQDAFDAALPHAAHSIYMPSWFTPDSIEHFLNLSTQHNASIDSIVFGQTPEQLATPRSRVADTIKRAVAAAKFDVPSLLVQQPWRWNDSQPLPEPEFAAWRTIVSQLADRQVVGSLPMPDGARAIILDGPGGGALAAWNDWADTDDAVINGYLGTGTLTVIDAFGNQEQVRPDTGGEHHIQLTTMPIFITGIDTNISLFRTLFRINPPFVLSLAAKHDLEIMLENPWPVVISGTIRIQSPTTWNITPRSQSFSVEPHGTRSLPIAATIGVSNEAGIHDVVAQIELQADTQHPVFLLATQVEVGLEHVDLTATARRAPNPRGGPDDVVVTLLIRNTSEKPITMNAFTIAPSFPRQQAPVSNIPPGASVVRQFTYHNAADTLQDARIRVGIEEVDGPLRLNKSVTLD